MKMKAYVLVLMSFLFLGGCASKNTDTHRTIVLQNKSSKEMHETILNIGSYQVALGFMGTNYAKVIANYPREFPDSARLSWSFRGLEHDEVVNLSSAIGGQKRGVLILTVNDDHIGAQFEAEKKPTK